MSKNHDRIQSLFLGALNVAADEREVWLIEQCGNQPDVLKELRALLEHANPSADPLEQGLNPDIGPMADVRNALITPGSQGSDAGEIPVDRPNTGGVSGDRNLLFGILALQSGLISEQQLVAAMKEWTFRKNVPLSGILQQQEVVTESICRRLDQMVDLHIGLHNNDVAQSINSLSGISGVAVALSEMADPEVQASLANLRANPNHDPRLESTFIGNSTSSGMRFRVLRPHAKGGLGEVFVAHDAELNRDVALKEIQQKHAGNSDTRSRFRMEAEITGALEHPGIVPVYGLGAYDDGRPFYAMRFIRGDSLKEAIRHFYGADLSESERNLGFRDLLNRFVDVCQAVEYAHSRGVLHRDLKPGNIMLGRFGETLVVDWGLSRATGRAESAIPESSLGPIQPQSGSDVAMTQDGSVIGTVQYMSPEQAAGRLDQLGPATDVYSLGAILYELLTGRPPIEWQKSEDGQPDIGATLKRVREGIIEPPESIRSDVAKPLQAVCLKALSRNPQERYASVAGLAEDIGRWLADEPVNAWPEPFTIRTRRWIRGHQTLMVSAAASVSVAVTTLSVMVSVVIQKNSELSAAYVREQDARELSDTNAAEADRQRTAAMQQSQLALSTLSAVIEDLQSSLTNLSGSSEVRRRLLATSLGKLDDLADSYVGAAAVDANTMAALIEMGEVVHRFGFGRDASADMSTLLDSSDKLASQERSAIEVARTLYSGAAEIGRQLIREDAVSAELKRAQYTAMQRLGDIHLLLGNLTEARRCHEESIDLADQLPGDGLQDRLTRATAMGMKGNLYLRENDIKQAMGYYRRFHERTAELVAVNSADFQTRHVHLLSMERLGDASRIQGNFKAAIEYYSQHRNFAGETLKLEPTNQEAKRDLTLSLERLGDTHSVTGNLPEALAEYTQLFDLRRELVADEDYDNRAQRDLATALKCIAKIHERLGEASEAWAHYQECNKILESLAMKDTTNASAQLDFSTSLNLLGDYAFQFRDANEALTLYQRSYDLCKSIVAENPAFTDGKAAFSDAALGVGRAHMQLGSLPKALPFLKESLSTLSGDAPDSSHDSETQSNISRILQALANANMRLGRKTECLNYFQRKLLIDQRRSDAAPDDVLARRNLTLALRDVSAANRTFGEFEESLKLAVRSHEAIREVAFANQEDALLQRTLAASYEQLGRACEDLGRFQEAIQHYQDGCKINRKTAERERQNPQAQRDLALLLAHLGKVSLRNQEIENAIQYETESLEITRRLLNADPDNADVALELSNCLESLAGCYGGVGQIAEAGVLFNERIAVLEQLADKDSSDLRIKLGLTTMLSQNCQVQMLFGQTDVALENIQKSLTIAHELYALEPTSDNFQRAVILSHFIAAQLHSAAYDFGKAIEHLNSAKTVIEPLLAANPDAPMVRQLQIDQRITAAKAGAAKAELATADWDAVVSHPDAVALMTMRMSIFSRKRDFGKVAEAAAFLRTTEPANGTHLYNAACGYARCAAGVDVGATDGDGGVAAASQSGTYKNLAIQCLREAIDAGFNDLDLMRRDPDLACLQTNPDFTRLLEQAAPVEADAKRPE